jgi:glycosyl transferase family 87
MIGSQAKTFRLSPAVAFCLALIGGASFTCYHQGLFMPRVVAARDANGLAKGYSFGNDFYQVWFSCRELLRAKRDPYTPAMTRDIQIGLYGRPLDSHRRGDPVDQRAFPYPAYTDLLFWPLAEISFPVVRVAVLIALLALTVASVLLWLRAFGFLFEWQWIGFALLLTMCSYPALEAFFAGQIGLLVVFLLAASIVSLQRRRFLLAGVLLALGTIKPQMIALAILYLVFWAFHDWRRRNRFLIGFSATMFLLFAGSLLILPHWIQSWVNTVLAYRHYTRPPLVTEVLTSQLGSRLTGPGTALLTIASVIFAAVLAWRHRQAELDSFAFRFTLSLLLSITTITILPGQAVYDHLILIPAVLLLASERRRFREAGPPSQMLFAIGAFLLFWPWISAFFLIVLRPMIAPAIFDSTPVFSLPIRTAASLPFAVFALLAWTWRLNVKNQAAS